MFRRSLRGRRGSRAAKSFNASMRFATRQAAESFEAHPGDNSRVVKVFVSEKEFYRLFVKRRSLVADLRHLDLDFETAPGGFVKPGDVNGDGTIDIGDPVKTLSFLFNGEGRLSCEGGDRRRPAGLVVADHTGDGELDISDPVAQLSWLFNGGQAHHLGEQCIFLESCADSCK